MNRRSAAALFSVAAGVVLSLAACSSESSPAPAVQTPPPGMSSGAESFIGGAWASTPVQDTNACELAVDAFCWTVEVGDSNGCEKGFAFEWQLEDAYGDTAETGRERVLTMSKNEFQDVGFHVSSNVGTKPTSTMTVTSASCI